jgi:hypothetical protein
MTNVLKPLLWIYGIILTLVGVGCVAIPGWGAKTFYGIEELTNGGLFYATMMGSLFIPMGIWLINVSRDPVKNITWIKFVLLKIAVWLVVEIYTLIKGYIEPGATVITLFVVDFIFGLAFLIFYPRKIKSGLANAPQS